MEQILKIKIKIINNVKIWIDGCNGGASSQAFGYLESSLTGSVSNWIYIDCFYNNNGAVITPSSCASLNDGSSCYSYMKYDGQYLGYGGHGASVVGWTTISNIPVWIIRNQWGINGYAYIQMDVDWCNIETSDVAVQLDWIFNCETTYSTNLELKSFIIFNESTISIVLTKPIW